MAPSPLMVQERARVSGAQHTGSRSNRVARLKHLMGQTRDIRNGNLQVPGEYHQERASDHEGTEGDRCFLVARPDVKTAMP